ncbi:UFC1-like protein [Mya arenaria]|uniref:Ubiquitin-fold modifier-conjugating enzyme 1 n=1 Tax=Mya arenaria TaxID=6604 RepID=A0ABY7E796_MYAAR|nr:UFC1-like protein [Mya arenaria]
MVDEATKKSLAQIPLLKTKAGPRDGELWVGRLKEEYQSLIKNNKDSDNDWFRLESNKEGTRWFGKCWYFHNLLKGGKICLTDHFKPLWARNVPKFGIAHAMSLGLGPWLAVEIPDLVDKGIITHKAKEEAAA